MTNSSMYLAFQHPALCVALGRHSLLSRQNSFDLGLLLQKICGQFHGLCELNWKDITSLLSLHSNRILAIALIINVSDKQYL